MHIEIQKAQEIIENIMKAVGRIFFLPLLITIASAGVFL